CRSGTCEKPAGRTGETLTGARTRCPLTLLSGGCCVAVSCTACDAIGFMDCDLSGKLTLQGPGSGVTERNCHTRHITFRRHCRYPEQWHPPPHQSFPPCRNCWHWPLQSQRH